MAKLVGGPVIFEIESGGYAFRRSMVRARIIIIFRTEAIDKKPDSSGGFTAECRAIEL